MQQLISSWLFQNKTCPLPGLGTLTIVTQPSESDFVHKQLLAPVPVIQFSEAETDTTALVNYISTKDGVSNTAAITALDQFAATLKSGEGWAGVGKFTTGTGNTVFEAEKAPAYFTPAVHAERVIHPEADHHILVGDKETTAAVMTEYYAGEEPKKDYWWIWAIVLAAVAIAVIVLYLNDQNRSATFGNTVDYRLA